MKPLSPAEHDRLIEEFIQMRGVTRCPAGYAFGVGFSTCGITEFAGFAPLSQSGCYWRRATAEVNKGRDALDFEPFSQTPSFDAPPADDSRGRNTRTDTSNHNRVNFR